MSQGRIRDGTYTLILLGSGPFVLLQLTLPFRLLRNIACLAVIEPLVVSAWSSQEAEMYAGFTSENVVVWVVTLLCLFECCGEETITLRF